MQGRGCLMRPGRYLNVCRIFSPTNEEISQRLATLGQIAFRVEDEMEMSEEASKADLPCLKKRLRLKS